MKKADCVILKMLGILFVVVFHAALACADEFNDETGQTLIGGEILTVAANMPFEWMSVAGQSVLVRNKNFSLLHSVGTGPGKPDKRGLSDGIGKSIEQISSYFFRYFSVDDHSADDPEARFRLRNHIRSFKDDPQGFELNLCFDIGYYSSDNLNIDAVRIESFLHHTFVSTIYYYEKKEIELGLSNVMINKLLLDGMKLEIQTNSYMSSGAVLLTMAL